MRQSGRQVNLCPVGNELSFDKKQKLAELREPTDIGFCQATQSQIFTSSAFRKKENLLLSTFEKCNFVKV